MTLIPAIGLPEVYEEDFARLNEALSRLRRRRRGLDGGMGS